jgi:hypothetical protein
MEAPCEGKVEGGVGIYPLDRVAASRDLSEDAT